MLGGCLGMSRNVYTVQTIRQAYKVNSKCVRLSTGSCGSAGSWYPELTTPFHDVDRRRAHRYYICERLSHAAFVET